MGLEEPPGTLGVPGFLQPPRTQFLQFIATLRGSLARGPSPISGLLHHLEVQLTLYPTLEACRVAPNDGVSCRV